MTWIQILIVAFISACAGAAISYGLTRSSGPIVQSAADSELSNASPLSKLHGRLRECEQLQQEMLEHLGRIEARDRMRKVRAARTEKENPAPEQETVPGEVLTTAELRRRLAQGKFSRS